MHHGKLVRDRILEIIESTGRTPEIRKLSAGNDVAPGVKSCRKENARMLYYSDGGPGPATKLLLVDAPAGGDWHAWVRAPAARWTVAAGWQDDTHLVQMDITMTGEFFMVDASEVPNIQQQMRDRYMAFH